MATIVSLASSFPLKTNTKTPNKSVVSLSSPDQVSLPWFSPRPQTLTLSPSVSKSPLTPIKCVASTELSPAIETANPLAANQTIEHIVLFKMKYGFSTYDYKRFIEAMNSLKCLPGVQYLSSGYIKDIYCAPFKEYTVFLHSRHATKEHMDLYMTHPLKHAFTMTYTEPFFEDYMLVDYVHAHDDKLDHPEKGNAVRTIFIKLQDGWAGSGSRNEDKQKQKLAIDEVKVKIEESLGELGISVDKMTFGEAYEGNGYPPAHKNFQVGILAAFSDVKELEALLTAKKFAHELAEKLDKAKVPLVPEHAVIVVDYEVDEFYNCDIHDLFRQAKEFAQTQGILT